MNKCLITKLDAIASNDSLDVFGGVTAQIEGEKSLGQNYYVVWTDSSKTKYKIKNGYLVTSGGEQIEGVTTKTNVIKAMSKNGEVATLSLLNKEYLSKINVAMPLKLNGFRGCVNLEKLVGTYLVGDIEGLADVKLTDITLSNNADVYGELSALSPTITTIISLHQAANNRITYKDANIRANSNCLMTFMEFPATNTFVAQEDLENYLIASACCAYGGRGSGFKIRFDNLTYQLSRKAKEALWFLQNKMYANVGDAERTAGTYFAISGVDISDITSEPNW